MYHFLTVTSLELVWNNSTWSVCGVGVNSFIVCIAPAVCTASHVGHNLLNCGRWDVKMDCLDPDACLESRSWMLALRHSSRYCYGLKQLRAGQTLTILTDEAQLCLDYLLAGCTLMDFCLADLEEGRKKKKGTLKFSNANVNCLVTGEIFLIENILVIVNHLVHQK